MNICIGLHGKECGKVAEQYSLLCKEHDIEHRNQAEKAHEAAQNSHSEEKHVIHACTMENLL